MIDRTRTRVLWLPSFLSASAAGDSEARSLSARSFAARSGRLFFGAAVGFIVILATICSITNINVAANFANAAAPRAVRGFLDLTYSDLRREHINLKGEWEFYWGEFVDPGRFLESADQPDSFPAPMYLSVPGTW